MMMQWLIYETPMSRATMRFTLDARKQTIPTGQERPIAEVGRVTGMKAGRLPGGRQRGQSAEDDCGEQSQQLLRCAATEWRPPTNESCECGAWASALWTNRAPLPEVRDEDEDEQEGELMRDSERIVQGGQGRSDTELEGDAWLLVCAVVLGAVVLMFALTSCAGDEFSRLR